MKKLFLILVGILIITNCSSQNTQKVFIQRSDEDIYKKTDSLISLMTLEEKINLLGGTGFATKAIPRLGIPEMNMTDGPLGVRQGKSTAFPSGIALGATWEPELAYKVGAAIARETKGKGRHIILAPCVNIARLTMGGRNFESFGEDPFLTTRFGVEYIKGVQSENVAATVKHFAVNNQEYQRDFVDVIVSQKALNEIYFPAFKAAVQQADVYTAMCSYNKVNGHYASENDYLLIDKLKNEWGFKGLVMSDWGAVHSSLPVANGGLDLEMPTGAFLNQKTLIPAINNGDLSIDKINDKVRRILYTMYKVNLFDNYQKEDNSLIDTKENRDVAYQGALRSIVLLKNENQQLPLNLEKIKKNAIIGPNANVARTGGGGSSMVEPINAISPLKALQDKIGDKIKITFAEGVNLQGDEKAIETKYLFTDSMLTKSGINGEYYNNKSLSGEPLLRRIDKTIDFDWGGNAPSKEFDKDNYSIKWTGFIQAPLEGEYYFSSSTDDGARLFINDQLLINDWIDHGVETRLAKIVLKKDQVVKIKFEHYESGGSASAKLGWKLPGSDIFKEALAIAKEADQVLIFAGTSSAYESEGKDRSDLFLPSLQDELIKKVSEVNPSCTVILVTGSPVVMNEWIDNVPALLQLYFGGSEMGNAIADVLIGNYNPSGKLPMTYPKRWEDCSAYPTYKAMDRTTFYDDGIFVGYRHFDKNNIEPLFSFGFGLSYTSFQYQKISITEAKNDSFKVYATLKNNGLVKGEEVIQLYITPTKINTLNAIKQLKAFSKVALHPEEIKIVELNIVKDDFQYFDEKENRWKIDSGDYKIEVGGSSDNLPLNKIISIK
ncbi:MAG: glycoside hydrolase family 3 C-terminal domain-containing protein [Melioribacteraceae bacterium]|nr:glycoside hydrolase family 3 C-terminal domain-containing protein [Melioribacteraceae bacterium]